MTDFRVALWSVDFSYPVKDMDAWLALVASKAAESKAAGAGMLVMPEYACVHWYHFAPQLTPGEGLEWSAGLVDTALEGMKRIAREHDIAIVTGTYPVAAPKPYPAPLYAQHNDRRANTALTRYFNRAFVIDRSGEVIHTQDKMVLTPWELDEDGDNMQGGLTLAPFKLDGVTFGLLVCLDVQQSVLVQALYGHKIDVLIVPSMTLHPSGYNRVLTCARARAIEGLIGVAVVGAQGVPPYLVGRETNYSAAGLYGPCEMDMKPDGIITETAPSYGMSMTHAGDLCIGDFPVDAIRKKRVNGAEAWPGVIKA